MQVKHRLVWAFLTLISFAGFATHAVASCPRLQEAPPCVEYWQADAVFVGVVNRVDYGPLNLALFGHEWTTVHITIEEVFKGVTGTGIVLNSAGCAFPFQEKTQYLVYARRNPNTQELDVRLGTSRTRLLSEASEDLEYIRGLSSAAPGSRVFGKVAQYTSNIKESREEVEPLQNVKVTLKGNELHQEVSTDNEGKYEFKRLPEGIYRISAESPVHLDSDEKAVRVDGRECVPLDISAMRKGRIAGRLLDMKGKPILSVPVSLVSADATSEQILFDDGNRIVWTYQFTGPNGRFMFSHLPPGRYLLVINRAEHERSLGTEATYNLPRLFYPGVSEVGGATVIVVGRDGEPREHEFRLPVSN